MTRLIIKVLTLIGLITFYSCDSKENKVVTEVKPMYDLDSALLDLDFVMGRFDPTSREDFVEIDIEFADRANQWLYQDTYEAFKKMTAKAKEDSIHLVIRSATRNFSAQKNIWERKWSGTTRLSDGTFASDIEDLKERALKILLYSSMPGTSRHHWGTDIDFNSFNNEYFENGEGLKIYQWLQQNAADFGFFQPYTSKSSGRTGYEEEKWHWSYRPLSDILTEYCFRNVTNEQIDGFDGASTAIDINIVENYILGISEWSDPAE